MGCHQTDAAEQAARRTTGERPPCPQRHLLGAAVRGAVAGPAGELRALHDLLQSLRPLAASWQFPQPEAFSTTCSLSSPLPRLPSYHLIPQNGAPACFFPPFRQAGAALVAPPP